MNNRPILAAAIALAACWCLVPEIRAQQDVSPSAFDKCRIVTSSDLNDRSAPSFKAYHVPVPQLAESPKLDLKSSSTARMYRTLLRQQVAKGPNFAGHYRVAVWGCGTSCANFAIVNLKTGRVIQLEDFYATSTVYFGLDNQAVFHDSQSEDEAFGFRKDSKLLVILGDLNEDESREGAFYFVLDDQRLRLIHSTPVKKNCESLRGTR
jgi:hypothetical protein